MPQIKKVELKTGKARYRVTVDVGTDPLTGRRLQKRYTFDRKADAVAALARVQHLRRTGELVLPRKLTVGEAIDQLLPALTIDVEPGTASNYVDALRPVRAFLGDRPLQGIDEQDVDDLVEHMLTRGRVRGGKPGTGVGVRSVSLTLGRFRSLLNEAVRRKLVHRNVAAHTKIPRAARKAEAETREARTPWSEAEVRTFLVGIRDERLRAPLLLSLLGMRPAEVCGLRWSDLDLDEGTLRIANTRTLVRGEVVEKGPKTKKGRRLLPLPEPVADALRTFRTRQATERLAAGDAYTATGYVLVDELGQPWRVDELRRAMYRLMEQTGARKVRLYDARHACLTHLAASGVPMTTLAAWAGHADGGALAQRVYIHPNAEHLRGASAVLADLLG
jgi:integrase